MDALRSSPAVLLHHDGELAEVRALLEDLGAHYVERLGASEEREPTHAWDVIIASPRRILNFRPCEMAANPTLIAILDGDSRTLRAHLRRIRIDLVVRRPVHPAALRLLVLHALYRGPERRRLRRVSVGADVRIRSGLLGRPATMTDFSLRGCRLLSRHAIARGKRLSLQLPARVTGDRPLRLKATVVRSAPASDRDPGVTVLGLRFDEPSPAQRTRLERVLAAHATGPAMLDPQPAAAKARSDEPNAAPTPDAQASPDPPRTPEPVDAACTLEEAPLRAEAAAGAGSPTERRSDHRHSYDRRIVALGDEATRVLLGRDISRRGMRVDANPSISLGDELLIALHAGTRAEPLVVRAVVQRDDGEGGMVLRFASPEDTCQTTIDQLMGQLAVTAGDVDDERDAGVIVTQIIERHAP